MGEVNKGLGGPLPGRGGIPRVRRGRAPPSLREAYRLAQRECGGRTSLRGRDVNAVSGKIAA